MTLGFDDATAGQARALAMLQRHGLRATFYVPSGLVGRRGHLGWAALRAAQAAGQEIGGHTRRHRDLTRLPPSAVRREVCADRRALLAHGLRATAFAYPYGRADARARRVVAACGYASGRLAAGGTERIPPRYRYATRVAYVVHADTPLWRIQRRISFARTHGGGWVQIVLHKVCTRCGRLAIAPRRLDALLGWLARQRAVEVRTASQVVAPRRRAVR